MKKKIIIILIALIILIIGGIFVYLKFFKKGSETLTYLNEVKKLSTQTEYLKETIPSVLTYLKTNNVTVETDYSKININNSNYKDCTGKITPANNVYTLTAECKNNEAGNYNINYVLTKSENLQQLNYVSLVNGGYIYGGSSDKKQNKIIGFLNEDGTIRWESKIDVETDTDIIQNVNPVSDGYLVFVQSIAADQKSKVVLIKLDLNGKVISTKKTDIQYYVLTPKTGNDITVVGDTNKLWIIDKDGNTVKELKNAIAKVTTISEDTIYYIDKNNNLVTLDKNGNEKDKIKLSGLNKYIFGIEIIANKVFVIDSDKAITYNTDGTRIKEFDYKSLAISKKIYSGKHQQNYIINIAKFNNNVYVNTLIDSYIMVDHYDQNLELVNRNIYEGKIADIGSVMYNNVIMMGESISQINYSEENKMFVKTVYLS